MDAELQQIMTLWEDKTQRAGAKNLAQAYVDSHPELADAYGSFNLDQMVAHVEEARANGNEEELARSHAWIISKPPIHIVGAGEGVLWPPA